MCRACSEPLSLLMDRETMFSSLGCDLIVNQSGTRNWGVWGLESSRDRVE